jgi:hypothetical protein
MNEAPGQWNGTQVDFDSDPAADGWGRVRT